MMTRQELNPVPLSPFLHRRGERLNVLHPRGEGVPLNLSALERNILVLVNSTLVTTSNLLCKHLTLLGWNENIHDVRKALDRLFRNKYLIKMEFMTPETRSLTKVYAIGKFGKEFLRSIGEVPNRTKFVSTMDAVHAKKILATLQYLLWSGHITDAGRIEMGAMVLEQVQPGFYTDHCFRAHGLVYTKDNRTVIVEAVRNEALAVKELADKLYRMERTVSGMHKLNLPVEKPEVVLVCETEEHRQAVERQLLEKECAYDFPLYLTDDAQTFEGPRTELQCYSGRKKLIVRFADSLCNILEKVME